MVLALFHLCCFKVLPRQVVHVRVQWEPLSADDMYLSPGEVFLLGESYLSQCPQVLPKGSTLNLPGSIRTAVLEARPLKTSATVVWACQWLGCFCSMMEDVNCKGNCGWQGAQPGQSFRAPSLERPFALFNVAVLKFFIIF